MGEERVFVATLSKLNRINQGNKFEVIGYKSVGLLAGLYSVVALSACPQDQTPTNGWNCSKMKINIWKKK